MLLVALLLLGASGPLSQASALTVTGPKRVTPGKEVTFQASGFQPNERLTVNLMPTRNRNGNCCGIVIKKEMVTDAAGNAVLQFRWPRRYAKCGYYSPRFGAKCFTRWKRGSRADVNVFGTGGRALMVVRIGKGSGCGKPKPTTTSGSACFKFSSGRAGAHFQCRLTGQGVAKRLRRWSACRSPKRYSGLKPGSKAFSVRAIDPVGGVGKPDKRRWRIVGEKAQASAAKLQGPKRVTPGKAVTFEASGFTANARRVDTHRWRIASSSAGAAANCGHVVITPRSGDGLSKIKALGISCRAARRKLRAWGKAGYRPPGPRGYRCRSKIPPRRSVCRRKGHRRPVISYLSGT